MPDTRWLLVTGIRTHMKEAKWLSPRKGHEAERLRTAFVVMFKCLREPSVTTYYSYSQTAGRFQNVNISVMQNAVR